MKLTIVYFYIYLCYVLTLKALNSSGILFSSWEHWNRFELKLDVLVSECP